VRAIATLLFAARRFQPSLAHFGIETGGQAVDQPHQRRCPRRALNIGRGRMAGGVAVTDVIADRVVEQHRILRHDAQRRAQRGLRDFEMS
jgi:hypothetical protein